jgi:hypothetical protein
MNRENSRSGNGTLAMSRTARGVVVGPSLPAASTVIICFCTCVVPAAQRRVDAVAEEGHVPVQVGAQRPDPGRLHRRVAALGHRVGALPVRPPVDHREQAARREPREGGARIARPLGDAVPEEIHRGAEFLRHQPGPGPDGGAAPVAGHRQRGAQLALAVLGAVADPTDGAAVLDQPDDLDVAMQRERRVRRGLRGDEREEVPLGHHRQVLEVAGQLPAMQTVVSVFTVAPRWG